MANTKQIKKNIDNAKTTGKPGRKPYSIVWPQGAFTFEQLLERNSNEKHHCTPLTLRKALGSQKDLQKAGSTDCLVVRLANSKANITEDGRGCPKFVYKLMANVTDKDTLFDFNQKPNSKELAKMKSGKTTHAPKATKVTKSAKPAKVTKATKRSKATPAPVSPVTPYETDDSATDNTPSEYEAKKAALLADNTATVSVSSPEPVTVEEPAPATV